MLRDVPQVQAFLLRVMRVLLRGVGSTAAARRSSARGYSTGDGMRGRLDGHIGGGRDGLWVLLEIGRDDVQLGSIVSDVVL